MSQERMTGVLTKEYILGLDGKRYVFLGEPPHGTYRGCYVTFLPSGEEQWAALDIRKANNAKERRPSYED